MQEKPDAQLLRAYLEGNEAAFREIVSRHTDLIYSAALRQVSSPDLAQDIAQSVFVDLVRKAKQISDRLTPKASLAGWLYRSTRFAVLTRLRDDQRRARHERQAMEQLITDSSPAPDWERIRPHLDAAMAELSDGDREALVLRYFKNHDFHTVGRALNLSDDAAQKRVSRAVERLREFFSARGVTIAASALLVLISANAVQSAPVALAATISTAALLTGTTAHASTVAAVTKAIAMTTMQKILITAAVVVVLGAGTYQAHQDTQLREQIKTLQQQQAPLTAQIRQLQHERDDAVNRLASVGAENEQLKTNQNQAELLTLRGEVAQFKALENDPVDAKAKEWLTKVNNLKQRLEQSDGAKIPELQYVTEKDWLNAASGPLVTDVDYRRALATLRSVAQNTFAGILHAALQKWSEANHDQFPTDLGQLQSDFDSPVDPAMLDRWQIVPQKGSGLGGDNQITQKTTPDEMFDARINIGTHGYGSTSDFLTFEGKDLLAPVYQAYKTANNGHYPPNPSELLPYATTPDQQTFIQKLIEQRTLQK
jgi:RNA polymerase sigma factor (sigma-70 family)